MMRSLLQQESTGWPLLRVEENELKAGHYFFSMHRSNRSFGNGLKFTMIFVPDSDEAEIQTLHVTSPELAWLLGF